MIRPVSITKRAHQSRAAWAERANILDAAAYIERMIALYNADGPISGLEWLTALNAVERKLLDGMRQVQEFENSQGRARLIVQDQAGTVIYPEGSE